MMPNVNLDSLAGPRLLDSVGKVVEASVEERVRLRKATTKVEGQFIGMLLKQMHASTQKNGLFEQRPEAATFREMFDEAVADSLAERGAFGIGDILFKALSRKAEEQSK